MTEEEDVVRLGGERQAETQDFPPASTHRELFVDQMECFAVLAFDGTLDETQLVRPERLLVRMQTREVARVHDCMVRQGLLQRSHVGGG